MAASSSFSSKSILIRKVDYGEADNIVTFFTEESGKLTAFARNAKKSKKRFGTSLDLAAFVNAHFSFKKNHSHMPSLNSVTVIGNFEQIRKDLIKIASASYMMELFYEMTAENVKNRNLFYFLHSFLESLNRDEIKTTLLPIYAVKFMRIIGLGPNFKECSYCGESQGLSKTFFVFSRGGIVCSKCIYKNKDEFSPLKPETFNILSKEESMGENFLKRLTPTNASAYELKWIVNKFVEFHLGKSLNSYRFMEELNGRP